MGTLTAEQRALLDLAGLGDLYDLAQLVIAEDLEGTWQWLATDALGNRLGPVGDLAGLVFDEALLAWSPWLDPTWPPQA